MFWVSGLKWHQARKLPHNSQKDTHGGLEKEKYSTISRTDAWNQLPARIWADFL